MATYCFTSAEDRFALFEESCTRGWLAAVLDFPRRKNREECDALAWEMGDALRSEVCYIPDGISYQRLVGSAWIAAYVALEEATEREIVVMASYIKPLPYDEALAFTRGVFSGKGRTVTAKAYAQFLAASSGSSG